MSLARYGTKDYHGLDGLEVEVDINVGLEPSDVHTVKAYLSDASLFKDKVVPVHIFVPSTTDRALLDKLKKAIAGGLRELGKEPAFNINE
jgi:hypothetical protein